MNTSDLSSTNDAELIAFAKQGRVEAFGELYKRYLDPIYRYIQTRVAAQEEAEDLCETVFLKSFEAIDRYQERGHPFSAYLYQVARNLLADHYRSQVRDLGLDEVAEPVSREANPEHAVERIEHSMRIEQAMMQLKHDYQEVIRLRVLLGLPSATVGEWMHRSPGAVRVLLHRALAALREELNV